MYSNLFQIQKNYIIIVLERVIRMIHFWEITPIQKEMIQILRKMKIDSFTITIITDYMREDEEVQELKKFLLMNPKATTQEIHQQTEIIKQKLEKKK